MDPRREGSISSIALSSDGLNYWHTLPLSYFLTKHEIQVIQFEQYDELSPLFHNLTTDSKK